MTASRSASSHMSLLSLTTPVAMGYLPLGAIFGFLFVQAGGSGWLAVLTSLLVYAGASQYMMIPMVVAGLPIGTIAVATLVLNLRHVFYGLSLLERIPASGLSRWVAAYTLTDETYSVLTALPTHTSSRTLVLLSVLNQGWWVLGTAVGVVLGAQVRLPWEGLDFVLTALFAVLTVEQWRARSAAWPALVGAGAYAAIYVLAPEHALVAAIAICVVVTCLVLPRAEGGAT